MWMVIMTSLCSSAEFHQRSFKTWSGCVFLCQTDCSDVSAHKTLRASLLPCDDDDDDEAASSLYSPVSLSPSRSE